MNICAAGDQGPSSGGMARHLAPFSWRQRMAEMVRRRSFGCVLPLGRHASTNGSKFVHCASDSIALSSFQEEQNARHYKQFKFEQALAIAPTQAVTGQELLRQCEALERGAVVSSETVRLPKGQDAAACWFYMGAVQDIAATVEEEGGPSLIGSCVPPKTTRLELVRAFTKYARAHREDLDLRVTALVIPALSEAFPCPQRRAASKFR